MFAPPRSESLPAIEQEWIEEHRGKRHDENGKHLVMIFKEKDKAFRGIRKVVGEGLGGTKKAIEKEEEYQIGEAKMKK